MNAQIQTDIETINNQSEELVNQEINNELFIKIYQVQNLSATKTENTNQLIKLLKNEVSEYKLSNQVGKIVFNEFIYVHTIGFQAEKEGKFELKYTSITNNSEKIIRTQANDKGRIVFAINDTVSSFSISYERKNLLSSKSVKINNFWIFGLNLDGFNQEVDYLKNLYDDRDEFTQEFEKLKNQIQQGKDELNTKKLEIDQYIFDKNSEIEDIKSEIGDLESTKADFRNSIQQLENQKEMLDSQISAKNSELERLNKNNDELKRVNVKIESDITSLEFKKEDLAKEVNLVPDNLIGFNKRTNESKKTYYWLSALPLLILSILFFCAWSNITSLANSDNISTLEQAYILLIKRLPLTLLILTLVSILIALLYKMLRYLMEIQQQELSLSKISVLARDVADSEYQHLQENEKQEHRIQYKMQLIREYFNSEFKRYQEFIKSENAEDSKSENFLNTSHQLKKLWANRNK